MSHKGILFQRKQIQEPLSRSSTVGLEICSDSKPLLWCDKFSKREWDELDNSPIPLMRNVPFLFSPSKVVDARSENAPKLTSDHVILMKRTDHLHVLQMLVQMNAPSTRCLNLQMSHKGLLFQRKQMQEPLSRPSTVKNLELSASLRTKRGNLRTSKTFCDGNCQSRRTRQCRTIQWQSLLHSSWMIDSTASQSRWGGQTYSEPWSCCKGNTFLNTLQIGLKKSYLMITYMEVKISPWNN